LRIGSYLDLKIHDLKINCTTSFISTSK